MHFNLFAVSVHLSCWLQTRVKYVASAWTIQLLINAVAATPCFCPALSRGSARSSACNLLMNVERLRCRPFRSQILIENCTRECTKRDDDPLYRLIFFNCVSFSWMKEKYGELGRNLNVSDSTLRIVNCVIFSGERNEIMERWNVMIITFIEVILSSEFISVLKMLNEFHQITIECIRHFDNWYFKWV